MGKVPKPSPPQATAVPYSPDLSGPSEFRVIKTRDEVESTYKLDDNTVLRVRPILLEVRRLLNQWAPDGEPVYVTKIGFGISTQAPSSIRTGAPVKARPRKKKKSAKK